MKQSYSLLLLFLLVFSALTVSAQTNQVALWGRWERTFQANPRTTPDPSIGLLVRLTAPSGKRHQVSAFWDGGNTWRVRFMPNEVGKWRFRTIAYPDYAGLHAQRGSFVAKKTKAANRFLQHGAIQVSRTGTYLEHADGTPFFWLGDTAWNGALMSKPDDWNRYLDDRVAKNFTAIQLVATQWRSAPGNLENEVAFTGKEKIQINPAFFKRMDARMDALNAKGLLAVPVLLWAIKGDENPGWYLPEDQAILLEKYLVARYGAHHVVWIPAGDTTYRETNGERWRRICRAVFDGTQHAPIVMHPQGMQTYTENYRNEKWLDIIGYQSGHGDDDKTLLWLHSGPIVKEAAQAPARPFINLEPPYEDHIAYQSKQRHTAYTVRRAMYWSMLNAPAAGVTYGAHGIWSWETEPREPLLHQGTGIAKPWFDAMQLRGSAQMKFLAQTFAVLRWWELRPDQSLIVTQRKTAEAFIAAAKTVRGDAAIIYLPTGGEVAVSAAVSNAEWVNPRDGSVLVAPSAQNRFRAPDEQDWLLRLRLRP